MFPVAQRGFRSSNMSQFEQRASIRFCVLLGKSGKETFDMIQQAYGENALGRSATFQWHRRFKEGRLSIEDDERSGRPSTSVTDEHIAQINTLVRENCRLTIYELSELSGISHGTCHTILQDVLNLHRVCQRMVPKNLTADQMEERMIVAGDNIAAVDKDPGMLARIITGDETWCFLYDPQSKRQSSVWKTPSSPRPKKFLADRSKGKVMLEVFFDAKGIVHYEFIPDGRTVDKTLYLGVLRRLRDAVRRKRPELWNAKSWVLHHDNAPAHRAFIVNDYLARKGIPLLQQPPYSPDLAPCDFFLFTKVKSALKGRRFQSSDEVKAAATKALKDIAKEGLESAFHSLYSRWQKCVVAQGAYFEGNTA